LTFVRGGKLLACLHHDQAVALWDLATGRKIGPRGHRKTVESVAFAPAGKVVVTGGDNTARFWDVSSSKELRRVGPEGGMVRGIALSPDGKILATAGKTVCLFEAATGKVLRRFPKPEIFSYKGVAFAPDGLTLAGVSTKNQIHLWDAATGKERGRLTGPRHLEAAAFSGNGKALAAVGWYGNSSDQGSIIFLWDSASGKELRQLREPQTLLYVLAGSGDGRLLAAGGHDGNVRLLDAMTGKVRHLFPGSKKFVAHAVAFSPDGRLLAGAAGDIILWELATLQEVRRFRGHRGQVLSLAFSPDGRRLVSGSRDTTALIWDVTGLENQPRAVRARLSAKELEALIDDLGKVSASRGQRAVWGLVAAPDQAVPCLRRRLRPEPHVSPKHIDRLIANLDSPRFTTRRKAARALEQLAEVAEPALRQTVRGRPRLETWEWVERLLKKLEAPVTSPERLRGLRALAVLEHIGTPAARRVLRSLADGEHQARLTQEAEAALKRLTRQTAGGR
jgi:hypothetical protein